LARRKKRKARHWGGVIECERREVGHSRETDMKNNGRAKSLNAFPITRKVILTKSDGALGG